MPARDDLRVTIGARKYVIDVAKFARRPVPALREQVDQGTEPSERSLSNIGIWKRSAENFVLGAGQEFFDDEEESSRLRFLTSKGIDPWGKRTLTLLNLTEAKAATLEPVQSVHAVSNRLFHRYGSTLRVTADPTVPSPTFTNITGLTGTINSISTDGYRLFIATTTGIFLLDTPTSTAASAFAGAAGTYAASIIGYANGRLLVGAANVLSEVSAAGAVTAQYTHPNPGFVWKVITSAPNAIYVSGDTGVDSEVYQITVTNTSGALAVPVFATALPDGETVRAIEFYAGTAIIATSRGVRLAVVAGTGYLTYGPVIEITGGVSAVESQGEFVWFGWSNYDGTSTGVGRLSLARFTSDLVPAYASDLMATTQGIVASVATFGGRRYFTVNGAGLYGEAATKVASGTYDSGFVTYGVAERKAVVGVEVQTKPLAAGQTVVGSVEVESGTSTAAFTHSTLAATEQAGEIADVASDRVKVKLTLTRGTDTSLAPVVRRWTLRAVPLPFRSEEIYVFVLMSDVVTNEDGRHDISFDTYAEWVYLKGLEQSRARVPFVMGDDSQTVFVDSVGVDQGEAIEWNDTRNWVEGTLSLRLITTAVS